MANINLLPWREEQRRERNRITLYACIAMWLAAAFVVFLFTAFMNARISHQEDRNFYVQSEINALSKIISEIEEISTT